MESSRHKRYRIVNKARFYIFILSILVLLFIIFYTFNVDAARGVSEIKADAVYVESGDTLWSLSIKYVNENMDIRDYIDGVIKYNNLQSLNIKPGQLIYMPVYNK